MINGRIGLWGRIQQFRQIFSDSIGYARTPKPPKTPYKPTQKSEPDWEPSFQPRPEDITEPHEDMTTLQRQYLYHFMMGMTLEDIRKLHDVSPRSVDQAFKRIRANFGANSNTHAVAKMVWWTSRQSILHRKQNVLNNAINGE